MEVAVRHVPGWFWLWDFYVGGGCTVTAIAVLAYDGVPLGDRFGAVAALAALALWALVFSRRVLAGRGSPWVLVAGMAVLLTAALSFSSVAAMALPAVYPPIFMSLALRGALVVTSAATTLPVVAVAVQDGVHSGAFATIVVLALLSFVITPVLGTWITKTIELNAEVVRLSHEAGTAAERARLAREIHDTLTQGFTSVVALSQAVESELGTDLDAARRHVELIRTTARDNLAEARAMVGALTPSALSDGSLAEAVRRQGRRLNEETGVAVTVQAAAEAPALSKAGEVVLLRAAQEAFANVRKHARASAVTVEIAVTADGVRLTVTDDGIGLRDPGGGFGLRGMRDRVEQIGGRMSVRGLPGAGTTLEIEVPA
ncbi:sensor histidine kinase [Actinomadura barringtoniae]|uniref:Sensor histidine kinase n=1 Tax=Actinomadura barringtoniae TaxID=1427535 RepID=A0A939T7J5_9ACTN|nr:sensor histidine kinase [Actinomadura barringtoniae]MBO2445945.1 sensor histidine kinase [Actinomadura barringtoniae]